MDNEGQLPPSIWQMYDDVIYVWFDDKISHKDNLINFAKEILEFYAEEK